MEDHAHAILQLGIVGTGRVFFVAIAAFGLLSANLLADGEKPPVFCMGGISTKSVAGVRMLKAGEEFSPPPYEAHVDSATTEWHGCWKGVSGRMTVARATDQERQRWEKILAGPANVSADKLFRDSDLGAGTYLWARIKKVDFPWGTGYTFLTQASQLTEYSPNNGDLKYEVQGITADRRYTIMAVFPVTHPDLPETADAARKITRRDSMRKDRDFQRIESSPAGAFKPSLDRVDALVGSLQIK